MARVVEPFLILLICLLVVTSNPSVGFNHPGTLDPWFYYSLMQHPARITQLFPDTYYVTRLPFILPGFFFYRILTPLAASYAFHLSVWLCAILAFYTTVRYFADRRTALLSVVFFAFYPYLWNAIGWDYPDGIGIAYYLLTIAFLTAAAWDAKPKPLLLAAAGVVFAADVYVNLVWVLFAPFLPVFWVGIRKIRQHTQAIQRAALYSAGGALSCTVVLGLASRVLGGPFLFYAPSIMFAVQQSHAPNPWKAPGWAWIWNAPWLLLPAVILGVGLITTVRDLQKPASTESRLRLLLYGNFLLCAGVFMAWEFMGSAFLETPYYATCLIGPMFLFLGVRFCQVPSSIGARAYAVLMGFAIVMLSLVWWNRSGSIWEHARLFGSAAPILLAILALTLATSRRSSMLPAVVTLCGLVILVFAERGAGAAPNDSVILENAFRRITESGDYCERYRKGRRIWIWYGPDRADAEFESVNSLYFYQFSQLGLAFPKLPDHLPNLKESIIVVLSTRGDAPEVAQASLRERGLTGTMTGRETVSGTDLSYTLTFFDFGSTDDIVNGDFEAGTDQWDAGWAKLQTQAGGQSGKYLEVKGEKGNAQFAIQWNAVRLKPKNRYKMSFWVKSGSSGDESFQAGLWDPRHSRWVAFLEGRSTGVWTPYAIDISNPPNSLLSVELVKNSATKGSMLFDTVTLSKE